MPATRTIEPVLTVVTLRIRQALLAFTFRALPNHFLLIEIVRKQQTTTRTTGQLATGDCGVAILRRAGENRAAVAADGFVFQRLFTLRAGRHPFLHSSVACSHGTQFSADTQVTQKLLAHDILPLESKNRMLKI